MAIAAVDSCEGAASARVKQPLGAIEPTYPCTHGWGTATLRGEQLLEKIGGFFGWLLNNDVVRSMACSAHGISLSYPP
jgi:hypothetical protein